MKLILCVVFIVALSKVNSTKIFKCPEFYTVDGDLMESKEDINSLQLVIPPHLMSHFKQETFSLVPGHILSCSLNNDVIKISLIEEDIESISLESTIAPSSSSTDPVLHSEGFMYSTENITVISNHSHLQEDGKCSGKLSKQQVQLTPSGFLFYLEEYYRPTEYCIQAFSKDQSWIAVRKCQINCFNERTPCIPLCCHLHEYVNAAIPCCQKPASDSLFFQPAIYDKLNNRLSLDNIHYGNISHLNTYEEGVQPHFVSFKYLQKCPDGIEPHHLFFNEEGMSTLDTKIHIRNDGKLAYIGDDRNWHTIDNFCVAGITNVEALEGEYGKVIFEMSAVVRYCIEEERINNEPLWTFYIVYIVIFSFSSIFLLLTVIVYVLLWDKQNIHGWTIMNFAISELFLFIFMVTSYSLGLFSIQERLQFTGYCVGSAIMAHFFFLSTFTWLTIINLDLWWTFKNFTPISERSKGKRRFCLYMLFAWGIPLSVVIVGMTLQRIYTNNESFVIVPNYGKRDCFLSSRAKGVYLYYIIGVFLLINIVLISGTIITIYNFKKSARIASTSSSKTKERSFKLFVKLVTVMGITWSLEFIMWLIHKEDFTWLVFLTDIFNILQAVGTFIIFVCKRKILNQLEQKYPKFSVITRPLLRILTNRSGTTISASTASKQTGSTNMTRTASSVLHRSRRQSPRVSVADCKV